MDRLRSSRYSRRPAGEPEPSLFVQAVTDAEKFVEEKFHRWRDALWALAMQPPTTVAGAIASLECGGCQVYGDLICANAAESLRRLTGGV